MNHFVIIMSENKSVVIVGASGFVARNFRKFLHEKNLQSNFNL